jgi:chemotaxis methyl-accepting protein methylase
VNDAIWDAVRDTVRAHTGLTLPPTMRSIIARSVEDLGITDPAAWLSDPARRERFFDRVYIGTTWFAREQVAVEALASALVPISRTRADRVVHVWSAGCSTGQEAYALAMTLTDAGCRPRILATDFHLPSLRVAREGRYSPARIPEDWRRRFFDPTPDGDVRVSRAIRDCVRFERHNFATEAPLAQQLDGVVCRNALIYFERVDALASIARLASACRDGGFLLLGSLEAPLLWMSINDPRFGDATIPLVELSPGSPLRMPTPKRPRHAPATTRASVPVPTPETTRALVTSRALERSGQLHDALRALDRPAATAPLDGAAHLARGMLLKQMGRLAEAVQELRAAQFLSPETWLASYQLAACLERLGDEQEALEAYRHTAAAIDSGGRSGVSPADESIEVLAASAAAACRRKLTARAQTRPPV